MFTSAALATGLERHVVSAKPTRGGCKNNGSGVLSVVVLSEEDAVVQEGKAGSSIHLSLEEFRGHYVGGLVERQRADLET